MSTTSHRLIQLGVLLFFLGLLTGMALPQFTNMRLGLSAHLEGVLNGMLLMVMGLIWHAVHLAAGWSRLALALLIYGTYANWTFTTLGAALGTGALMPIAAPGRQAAPWQEAMMTAGLVSVGLTMLAAVVLILWGLGRKAAH